MTMPQSRRDLIGASFATAAYALMSGPAAAQAPGTGPAEPALATAWIKEHATRARLVAGGLFTRFRMPGGTPLYLAGVEIEVDEGWKTYWRNPGSSGVPPRFEWTGSDNLAVAAVSYPAPQRFKEKDGDTIGYKTHVVLPIGIQPLDPAKPVTLNLALEYGVCREVCVPAQMTLKLQLPPNIGSLAAPAALTGALDRLPRHVSARRDADPKLERISIALAGDKPHLVVEAIFPDARGADVFTEAPDGLWLPLATDQGPVEGGPRRRFHIDLTDGADIPALKGQTIRLTLVSETGATETEFKLE